MIQEFKQKVTTRQDLLAIRKFLDHKLCARICLDVRSAPKQQVSVIGKDGQRRVDETMRRAKTAEVSARTVSLVEERLMAFKVILERHFGLPLTECEVPRFLVYGKGDFHRPHTDCTSQLLAPKFVQGRKVSTIFFLNMETEIPRKNSYCGGTLTLYKPPDAQGDGYGFTVKGEAGLLVAFRSHIVHEVKTVVEGERYTVVSWFS